MNLGEMLRKTEELKKLIKCLKKSREYFLKIEKETKDENVQRILKKITREQIEIEIKELEEFIEDAKT